MARRAPRPEDLYDLRVPTELALSPDGRFVAFTSYATNLVPGQSDDGPFTSDGDAFLFGLVGQHCAADHGRLHGGSLVGGLEPGTIAPGNGEAV